MSFATWAANPNTDKVYVAELTIKKISDGATKTIRIADDDGLWDGTNYFVSCLAQAPVISQRAQSLTHGQALVSFGALTIRINEDTELVDGLTWDEVLADYTLAGQAITIKVGGSDLAWASWGTVFAGYMGQPSFNDEQLVLPVYSNAEKTLATLLPPNEYDNTYPSATEGRAIPLCWGWCYNVEPVLTDETNHIYQVHDGASYGAIEAIPAVYVDGVLKTLATDYTVDLSAGTITFTSDPGGKVTADVKGRQVDGSFVDKPGEILSDILQTFCGFSASDLDSAAFTAFNAAVTYPVGLYLNRAAEAKKAIDALLNGLLCIWGTKRDGTFTVLQFSDPGTSEDLALTDQEILDISWDAEERLYWKARIGGERNWNPNGNPSASVSEDRRTWLTDEYRWRSSEDSSIQDLYPLAGETQHSTLLKDVADCDTVAGAWLDLFGVRRRVATVKTKLQPLSLGLGQVVKITRDRHGLSSGWYGRVVDFNEGPEPGDVTMRVWG